jgi:hypothetical protein
MSYTYFSLLLDLKNKGMNNHENFVNYLMLKYAGEEPLFDKVSDWSKYFINEDVEELNNILCEMEQKNGKFTSD